MPAPAERRPHFARRIFGFKVVVRDEPAEFLGVIPRILGVGRPRFRVVQEPVRAPSGLTVRIGSS